jgi:hypothetical protein
LPILAQEVQIEENKLKIAFSTIRSYPRLLGEHVQKVLQKLTTLNGKESFFPLYTTRREAAHSAQKNKLLVITFEWKVRFG